VNKRQVTVPKPLPVSSDAKSYLQQILLLNGTDKSTAVAIAAALLGDRDQAFRCLLLFCPRETPSVPYRICCRDFLFPPGVRQSESRAEQYRAIPFTFPSAVAPNKKAAGIFSRRPN
jgi:hypothetical protein